MSKNSKSLLPVNFAEHYNFFSHLKYEHLVAGTTAGLVATLALHPLDVIKIRFAVNDGHSHTTPKYNGIINAFRTIYKNEKFKGLYRGVVPNLIGAGSSWGLYFFFYNSIKNLNQKLNNTTTLAASSHLVSAAQAGLLTLIFTNPIWVIKTRMCLQYSDGNKVVQNYNGTLDAFVKIYKSDGIRGYYKGFVPGVLGVSHGAVQFTVYEEMKKFYYQYYNISTPTKLGTLEYLMFSASSKLIAVCVTYPYQVVRARLQNQHYNYSGVIHCVSATWNFEGWRGFYKGMGTNLIRVTPATMITFIVYENISDMLLKDRKNKQLNTA